MGTPRVIHKLDFKCGAPFVHLLLEKLGSRKNICIIKINYLPSTLRSGSGWEVFIMAVFDLLLWKASVL